MTISSPESSQAHEVAEKITAQAERIKDAVRVMLDAPNRLETTVKESHREALVQAAAEAMELCYIAQSEHGLDGTINAARAEIERDAILALLHPDELERAIEDHKLWCSGYGNHKL